MFSQDKKIQNVADSVRKVMDEALKGNQAKLDVDNDKKIEASDLAKLRAMKNKMKEETEELDEISKNALKSYYKGSVESGMKAQHRAMNTSMGGSDSEHKKNIDVINKRVSGQDAVTKRLGSKETMSMDKEAGVSRLARYKPTKPNPKKYSEGVSEETEQIGEASADKAKELLAAKKERDAENQKYKFGSEKKETSARKVSGSSYGGSNQKPEAEEDDEETPKKRVRTITGATKRRYNTKAYESFSSIIDAYNKDGLKSLAEMLVAEEEHPDEKEDKALIKKMIKKSEAEDDEEDKALVKKMTKESVSEIVEYPLDVDGINNAGISAPIYNEAMEQTPSMSHRTLYAQTYAKHGGTIGKAKAAGELAYRAVEKKHGKEASDTLRTYHTNNQNESFEIAESDLPTTKHTKEKVVVMRHKDSDKEIHIVSHAVPEYQKRGYYPVTKGE